MSTLMVLMGDTHRLQFETVEGSLISHQLLVFFSQLSFCESGLLLELSLLTTLAILKNSFFSSLTIALQFSASFQLSSNCLLVFFKSLRSMTIISFFYAISVSSLMMRALCYSQYCSLSARKVAMIYSSLALSRRQAFSSGSALLLFKTFSIRL